MQTGDWGEESLSLSSANCKVIFSHHDNTCLWFFFLKMIFLNSIAKRLSKNFTFNIPFNKNNKIISERILFLLLFQIKETYSASKLISWLKIYYIYNNNWIVKIYNSSLFPTLIWVCNADAKTKNDDSVSLPVQAHISLPIQLTSLQHFLFLDCCCARESKHMPMKR